MSLLGLFQSCVCYNLEKRPGGGREPSNSASALAELGGSCHSVVPMVSKELGQRAAGLGSVTASEVLYLAEGQEPGALRT